MLTISVAFLSSLILNMLIVRYKHIHNHFSGDLPFAGRQKFHNKNIPRIGGVGIFLALTIAALIRYFSGINGAKDIMLLLIASGPAFFVGLGEDITKSFSIKLRLFGTTVSAFIAGQLFDSWITRVDFIPIDYVLAIPIISIFFTCFAIAGLTNAYNMIDGFNGLSSVVAIISLSSLCFVAFKNNDSTTLTLSMVMIGAILGFVFWNYPHGKIFLGDGGAYLIGFWVSFLSILLVFKNPSVSPWYAVLVNAYPILETLFTIWRRGVHQRKNPTIADNMHLHTLIYRRVIEWHISERVGIVSQEANAKTSSFLWVLTSFAVIPATIFWENSIWLIFFTFNFFLIYCFFYWSIVKFKIPTWIR